MHRSLDEVRFTEDDMGRSRDEVGFTEDDMRRSRDEVGFTEDDMRRSRDEVGFTEDDMHRSLDELRFTEDDMGRSLDEPRSIEASVGRSLDELPSTVPLFRVVDAAYRRGLLEVDMVIRVATFDKKPAAHDDEQLMGEFRRWMKSQPGFCAAWHASDSKTGKALSISVWKDMPSVLAMRDRPFPGGPIAVKPDRVELFDEAEEF